MNHIDVRPLGWAASARLIGLRYGPYPTTAVTADGTNKTSYVPLREEYIVQIEWVVYAPRNSNIRLDLDVDGVRRKTIVLQTPQMTSTGGGGICKLSGTIERVLTNFNKVTQLSDMRVKSLTQDEIESIRKRALYSESASSAVGSLQLQVSSDQVCNPMDHPSKKSFVDDNRGVKYAYPRARDVAILPDAKMRFHQREVLTPDQAKLAQETLLGSRAIPFITLTWLFRSQQAMQGLPLFEPNTSDLARMVDDVHYSSSTADETYAVSSKLAKLYQNVHESRSAVAPLTPDAEVQSPAEATKTGRQLLKHKLRTHNRKIKDAVTARLQCLEELAELDKETLQEEVQTHVAAARDVQTANDTDDIELQAAENKVSDVEKLLEDLKKERDQQASYNAAKKVQRKVQLVEMQLAIGAKDAKIKKSQAKLQRMQKHFGEASEEGPEGSESEDDDEESE